MQVGVGPSRTKREGHALTAKILVLRTSWSSTSQIGWQAQKAQESCRYLAKGSDTVDVLQMKILGPNPILRISILRNYPDRSCVALQSRYLVARI